MAQEDPNYLAYLQQQQKTREFVEQLSSFALHLPHHLARLGHTSITGHLIYLSSLKNSEDELSRAKYAYAAWYGNQSEKNWKNLEKELFTPGYFDGRHCSKNSYARERR